MKINDLDKVRTELLRECPWCDMGLSYACVCPPAELDWRPIVHDLVTEIEELRAEWAKTGEALHASENALEAVRLELSEEKIQSDFERRLKRLEDRLQNVLDVNNLWDGS